MDKTLIFAFQECLRTVAGRSKSLTRPFTCMKVSPCLFAKDPEIVYVDLNSILTEGRGLQWFTTDGLNSITLKFRSVEAITLPRRSVKVQFSRQEADVVDVKPLDGGILEIFYRADGADALGLTIIVSDQIVCQTTAQLGMSVETAMAELEGMKRTTVDSSKYFSILLCWPENAFVVAAALKLRYSCDVPWPAPVLLDIIRRHMTEADIQWRALSLLSWLLCIDLVEEVLSLDGWDQCIYASMDAFPDDSNVQDFGCVIIKYIAKKSFSGKKLLLSGRALELSRRHARLRPQIANDAIKALS
jgi:hypothetical protein